MIESPAELASFCNPTEFGVQAVLTMGGVALPQISVIPDTASTEETPGANANSGRGSFAVGAAQVTARRIQAITTHMIAAAAKPEDTLEILSGEYVGIWRINRAFKNNDIVTLHLNKRV